MLQKLIDSFLYLDYTSWYYVNVVWHNRFLDAIAPYFSNQWVWAPAYLYFLVFMPYNFGNKGLFWCAGFVSAFLLGESISSYLIKPLLHRASPCNNAYLALLLHPVMPCTSGYSFTSSLATNHFSIALFLFHTIPKKLKWIGWAGIAWAALASYGQVYSGLSFPSDVLCGALLGCVIGSFLGKLFNNSYRLEAAE